MNMPVLIFPEGGIKRKNVEREPHGGVVFLAEHTDAIVVPVRISGVEDMNSGEFYGRKRRCTVTLGEPIKFSRDNQEEDPERYKRKAKQVVDAIYSI